MRESSFPRGAALSAAVFAGLFSLGQARAAQLATPTITASARPFNASFTAANLFDAARGEFASLTQGAGTPLSTDPNNGTWVNFDFGSPVTMDTFILRSRFNSVDAIGTHRLIFSPDPTFDETDQILTFASAGRNGAGPIERFAPKTAQYVRWEVTTTASTGRNLGGAQMYFMSTPAGHFVVPTTTVYNGYQAFSPAFALANAANDNAGTQGSGNEYASLNGASNTFVDFDLGQTLPINGFDFFNRDAPSDGVKGYDMIFSNTPDFSSEVEHFSYLALNDVNAVNSKLFDPVNARYVRFQVTSALLDNANTGVSEMTFYSATPVVVPEPVGLSILGGAGMGALLRRGRRCRA